MRSIILSLVFLLIALAGCTPPPCSLKTANTTQPVLLGNIKNIQGKVIDPQHVQQDTSFSISVKSSQIHYYAIYVHGWNTLTEGSNKVDAELLPFVDSAMTDTTEFVKIDKIRFHSWGTYLLFYLGMSNHGWLDGSVYKETSFQ